MTPTPNDLATPEKWEAADMIEALKGRLNVDSSPCPDPQTSHALLRANIWIIRRLDLNGRKRTGLLGALLTIARQSPVGALAVAIMFFAYVHAKSQGIELPWLP